MVPKKLFRLCTRRIGTGNPLLGAAKETDGGGPFDGKIALVTGGASGVGLATTKLLLQHGVKAVAIADKNEEKGRCILTELTKQFGPNRVMYIRSDNAKPELIDWAFKNTFKAYDRLDIFVNNADEMNDACWQNTIAANVTGTLAGNLLALQYMSQCCKGGGGYIVNVGSTMGANPFSGLPIYSMTQASVLALTRSLGDGCYVGRTGIKVMCVCAGLTDTEQLSHVLGRTLNPRFAKELEDEMCGEVMQPAVKVAEAVVGAIEDGESGALWIADCGVEPFKFEIPYIGDIVEEKRKKKRRRKKKDGKKKVEDKSKDESECETKQDEVKSDCKDKNKKKQDKKVLRDCKKKAEDESDGEEDESKCETKEDEAKSDCKEKNDKKKQVKKVLCDCKKMKKKKDDCVDKKNKDGDKKKKDDVCETKKDVLADECPISKVELGKEFPEASAKKEMKKKVPKDGCVEKKNKDGDDKKKKGDTDVCESKNVILNECPVSKGDVSIVELRKECPDTSVKKEEKKKKKKWCFFGSSKDK